MSVVDIASNASKERGYWYYKDGNVLSIEKKNNTEYVAKVKGSGENVYDVLLNIEHPRKSSCNCPYAEGTKISCKHKIAVFFQLHPVAADEYYKKELEWYYDELDEEEELDSRIDDIIFHMSESDAKSALEIFLESASDYQKRDFCMTWGEMDNEY